jgi:hypothetical protein
MVARSVTPVEERQRVSEVIWAVSSTFHLRTVFSAIVTPLELEE